MRRPLKVRAPQEGHSFRIEVLSFALRQEGNFRISIPSFVSS
jgi:hypothetical protein